ncbi:MAG: hypothetical protein JWO80_5183 [Bryobacterales bacterium]|nr:hypothetical protein [Bryobacterales bacterium]
MRRTLTLAILCSLLACRKPETTASLLRRLPTQDATVLSVDVQTLRHGGLLKLLAANKTAEEPEYQTFIQNSGFDYQRDLDAVEIAFAPSGTFLLVRGRFDWKKLEAYATANGGGCYNKLCRMQGSTPERRISFLPLDQTLMALAISTDDLAASRLTKPGPQREIDIPTQPVWLSIPGASLQRPGSMPQATKAFAGALVGADRVMLTLGPHGDMYQAGLEAVCKSPDDAKALAEQLTKLTGLLREVVKTKAADDLPALLAAGSFTRKDQKVFGYWPIRKTLFENLAGM